MQQEPNLEDIVERLELLERMVFRLWGTVFPPGLDAIEEIETKLGPNGETIIPKDFAEGLGLLTIPFDKTTSVEAK